MEATESSAPCISIIINDLHCCAGFVLVKKVPGTMHFLAKSPGHSFDFHAMNMSHVVHHYYFGVLNGSLRGTRPALPHRRASRFQAHARQA